MLKFAVVIPFRPKIQSIYWDKESELLQKTVQSVMQQTYPHVKTFVVYTDEPVNAITDKRVQYVQLPFAHQRFDEIPIREVLLQKFKSEKMVVRRWDKARRVNWGCKLAKEEGYDYIMMLDADDLLSKNLFTVLAAAAQNGACAGWYMHSGFLYKPGTPYFLLVPNKMRFLNGSTHILKSDLILIPDFQSTNWLDYNLFIDHGWVKTRLKEEKNIDLIPIKKPMLVYVAHGSNISKVYSKEYGKTFKNVIKHLLRARYLSKRKKEEFSIQ